MMIIEITIINSSSVNPACAALLNLRRACWKLPVTVLLSIQCRLFRFRAHVKDVLTAPRAGVSRVVTGPEFPLGLSGHRIDRYRAQINLLLGRRLVHLGCRYVWVSRSRSGKARHHVHAINESVEIRRVAIGIVNAKDRAVADNNSAPRIDGD